MEEPAESSQVDETAAAEHESDSAFEQTNVDAEGSQGLDALESTGTNDSLEPTPLDELGYAIDTEVVVEFEEPDVRPRKKVKKGKKPKEYAGAERRKRSDQEILTRLLEKNELILQLSKKNVRLEAQAKATEDRRLRVAAEFENYRKRTRKEWELLKQQTTAEVILEILEVVDDFDRAFSVVGNRSDDFVQGIRLIHNNMMSVLVKFGVSKMEALHVRFDPTFHMAVANLDSKDVESNHVVEVIQDGYLLGDTVIRPAKVVIAK